MTPHAALLPALLALCNPAPGGTGTGAGAANHLLQAADQDGNTALHYASAYGQLKCVRALLEAGADPGRRNRWSWMPVSYSFSVQAEVYFRGLVGEGGRGREGEGVGRG